MYGQGSEKGFYTKTNGFFLPCRKAKQLSNERANMYPIERTVVSKNCRSKRCEVCINVNETSTFTSTVTAETFLINLKFDCNARCLVYFLTCRKYKILSVGQTVDQFCSRWNNYKSDSRKYSQSASCLHNICLTTSKPRDMLRF